MNDRDYFFCGVGGSGMRPLAEFLRAGGHAVAGSDRSFDQGRFADIAQRLRGMGVSLYPQDGSGLTSPNQILVTSSAVEPTIPDVAAAQRIGARQIIRAELLAELTNSAPISCGVAGTSGKSTTTGMLAHILSETGRDPSVVNGAVMLGQQGTDRTPQGWRRGESDLFVAEVDESDGSIARYDPSVGVITNISEDHKSMEELMLLFGGYAERSTHAVLGIDSEPVAAIAQDLPSGNASTFRLVTASFDKTAKLWQIHSPNLISIENGHELMIFGVDVSPDGRTIATASADGTTKLWDIEGNLIQTLTGHSDTVNSVSFSPDSE
ncbi:MAG: Mur ligase domain-containing protein, partial [Pseudomonadota bacterium]